MGLANQNGKAIKQKRSLVTLGIFSYNHWPIFRPNKNIQADIYKALKQAGFRETIWQFVYRGQLGGLILPLDGGKAELHVRFYADTIEAEFEVGRHFLGHFLRPRFQAESMVLNIIKKYLPKNELRMAMAFFREDISEPFSRNFTNNFDCSFIFLAISFSLLSVILVIFNLIPSFIPVAAGLLVALLYKTLPNKNTVNQPL